MIEQAVSRLDQLATADPTVASLLRLQAEALRGSGDGGWADGVPSLDRQQAEQGVPLLHRQTLRADRGRVRRLLARLAQVAARENEAIAAQAQAFGRAVERGGLDAAVLLHASVTQQPARLERLAEDAAIEAGLLATLGHIATLPLLQACGQRAATLVEGLRWDAGFCPACAAWPTLCELRGLERARRLRCGRCGADWSSAHQGCIFCGNGDSRSHGYLAPERQRESRRAVTCDACGGYLKAVTTLQPIPPAEIVLMDAQTLELDMAALDQGYGRPGEPGFPLEVTVELTESRSRWSLWR